MRSGQCLPQDRPLRASLLLAQASRRPRLFPSSPPGAPQYTPPAKDRPNAQPSPGTTPALQATSRHVSASQRSLWAIVLSFDSCVLGTGPSVHCGLGPGRSCPELNLTFQLGHGLDAEPARRGVRDSNGRVGAQPWCGDCSSKGSARQGTS